MGYRFELQHANMVAYLIDGNIETFIDLAREVENWQPLKEFFKNNLEKRMFFSSREYEKEFYYLFHELEHLMKDGGFHEKPNRHFKKHLYELSHLIGRAKVKGLLLSGRNNRFMTDRNLLKKLVDIHPEDSCLILQISDLTFEKSVNLINTFRAFEEALKNFDKFPGVLLWDDQNTLFIPTKNEENVIEVFEILAYERHQPLQYLKERYYKKENYIYLLHMSDLHLGKVTHGRKNELFRLLNNHSIHKDDVPIIPILTGDLMDSPNQNNKNKVDDFISELNTQFNHKAISVLGNHDVDESGIFSFFRKNKQATMNLFSKSKLQIFNEYRLIIIKICSNRGGNLARGEVGEEQLTEIASELDNVPNIEQYTCIAILHHHPIEISNPDWYDRHWYEKILGRHHEKTMELIDSERFLEWCRVRNIKTILHGHKHIPNIQKENHVYCIGAGSATGEIKHVDNRKTYISYNVIKYDLDRNEPIQASIYFEDVIGTSVKHLKTEVLV
ncbi:MAG: metallophosphoesterase [Arcobacteraceae bacterium]